MSELDRLIETTLHEEDRAFLAKAGREPGYLGLVADLFSGSLGWITAFGMLGQAVLFIAGVWCAWEFFQADDTLMALRWGLPAAVLLISMVVLKVGSIWPTLQTNRLLREVKRLELQVARAERR